MEEVVVTRLWMAGVVAIMIIFGIVAVIGYRKKLQRDAGTDN